MYIQRPVKGGRKQLPACVLGKIHARIEADARRFNVSKSFVVATALAHVFGINEQEDYKIIDRKKN